MPTSIGIGTGTTILTSSPIQTAAGLAARIGIAALLKMVAE
ncbi:hypothetical protein [Lysobacter gummosus]